ncbi:class I SAM-dependent methyltransferase [Methylotetracoccus oryzae]|uniref:class I SAM-dependent methyltransferase n=1 Tax=Methylotetracoccus oryzae TaxID=1919059 RepID=UPI0013A56067
MADTLAFPFTLPVSARMLDFGYGAGGWLRMMTQCGYKRLAGFDIPQNRQNEGRLRDIGISVFHGKCFEAGLGKASYDLIRMEHVLEHVSDPIRVLKCVMELLCENGFVVMTVPSAAGFAFGISPEKCTLRQSPFHLFLHSKASLRALLESVGFVDVRVHGYGVPGIFGSTLGAYLPSVLRPLAHGIFLILGPFYTFAAFFFDRPDFISVVARKAQ